MNPLYQLNLDFTKGLNFTKAIMARQGDSGVLVEVHPFMKGVQVVPAGYTFTLKGTTPSGRYVDAVGTIKDNIVEFSLDGRFMSESGYYSNCYVEMSKGDTILTSQDIIFFSLGVSDISQGQANEYVSQLEELIRKYNETFDAFMAELSGRVNSLNTQITDLTGQAKTLQDKLDALKEEISKLGNLQVMYSNSIDFGDYDYSGNPNIAPNVGFNDFYNNGSQTGYTAKDGVDHIAVTKTAAASAAGKLVNLRTLLPNKTYTLSVDVWVDTEVPSGAISCGFQLKEGTNVRTVWALIGKPVSTNRTTYSVTFTTAANFVTTEESRITFWFGNSAGACTGYLGYNIKIEEGSTATPYQPNLLDAPYYLSKVALGENIEQYKYRGIAMRDSNNPKDYVWDLAPKYVENNLATDTKISEIVSQAHEYTDNSVAAVNTNLTNTADDLAQKINANIDNIAGISNAMPLFAVYGEGRDLTDSPDGTKIPIGTLIATDFFHTASDLPYTISSDGITLTATRNCVLFFEGSVKLHGNNTFKYAYVKIRKNGSDSNFANVGSSANLNYITSQAGQYVHTLVTGDKVEFTLSIDASARMFHIQLLSLKISELKPV